MEALDERAVAASLPAILSATGATEPVEFDWGPTRLTGGRSADLFAFRLSAGPADVIGRDLVVRVLPRRGGSVRECLIQRELAGLGYPTPDVVRIGEVDGSACTVMAHVAGQSLFDALGPLGALRRAPERLAQLMLTLHEVDPTAVERALQTAGVADADADVGRRARAEIDERLARVNHPRRRDLTDWFDDHGPPRTRVVVCHGDLHALNILVDGERPAVIDWELAGLGPPGYDVARTSLLLRAVPMEISRAARPLIMRLGARAARRFEGAYAAVTPIDRAIREWCETLHCARLLTLILVADAGFGTDPVVEGWRPATRLLDSSLRSVCGLSLLA